MDTSQNELRDIKKLTPSSAAAPLMSWSIRTSTTTPSDRQGIYGIFLGAPLATCTYITWRMRNSITEDFEIWLMLCLSIATMGLLTVAMLMQKTAFNYKIHLNEGEMEQQLYFPDFAGGLFKGIAAITIIFFVLVAILTGSLLFLLGPVAVALGSALKLMNWERPPVEYEKSMPWGDHHFVTVDRKYRIIVVHTTDITTGFKARFPKKDLFEQYLAFLHTVVAPHAEFTEKVWKW